MFKLYKKFSIISILALQKILHELGVGV